MSKQARAKRERREAKAREPDPIVAPELSEEQVQALLRRMQRERCERAVAAKVSIERRERVRFIVVHTATGGPGPIMVRGEIAAICEELLGLSSRERPSEERDDDGEAQAEAEPGGEQPDPDPA